MKTRLLILLPVLAAATVAAQAGETDLLALAAKKAAVVKTLHDKATLAIVQVAQDPAFPAYFEAAHFGHHDHAHEAKVRIDHISLATQARFHVEEMCLIDLNGAEVSRIVKNQIAYDLSLEEASAPFFEPSFARSVRTTYIAPLYMSPDVARWVMAYTTPIEVDGEKVAILHYEHGLDVYQAALFREAPPPGTFVLAVDSLGYIVADSRSSIAIEQKGESEDPSDYFEPFNFGAMEPVDLEALQSGGVAAVQDGGADYIVAARSVADWTIVAVEKL